MDNMHIREAFNVNPAHFCPFRPMQTQKIFNVFNFCHRNLARAVIKAGDMHLPGSSMQAGNFIMLNPGCFPKTILPVFEILIHGTIGFKIFRHEAK
jgi:hypothetical protein